MTRASVPVTVPACLTSSRSQVALMPMGCTKEVVGSGILISFWSLRASTPWAASPPRDMAGIPRRPMGFIPDARHPSFSSMVISAIRQSRRFSMDSALSQNGVFFSIATFSS